MVKKIIRKRVFKLATLDFHFHVFIANDFIAVAKRFKAIPSVDLTYARAAMMELSEEKAVVIMLRPNATVGEIAHESWHAIHSIFKSIGAGYDDELIAYHLEYLVDHAYKTLIGRKT